MRQRPLPLELYMPVPAHRAAWKGDDRILVATAHADHEAPVAYDVRGRRQILSADAPPGTPVLALVPVETDFGENLQLAAADPAAATTAPAADAAHRSLHDGRALPRRF